MTDGKVHIIGGKLLIVGGKMARCDSDCCGVACPHCSDGLGPDEFQVVLDNIQNGDHASCTQCSQFNDTYVCTTDSGGTCFYPVHSSAACRFWNYHASPITLCTSSEFMLDVCVSVADLGGDTYEVAVQIHLIRPLYPNVYWRSIFKKQYTGKPDCRNISGENIPHDSEAGNPYCHGDTTPATCILTAL